MHRSSVLLTNVANIHQDKSVTISFLVKMGVRCEIHDVSLKNICPKIKYQLRFFYRTRYNLPLGVPLLSAPGEPGAGVPSVSGFVSPFSSSLFPSVSSSTISGISGSKKRTHKYKCGIESCEQLFYFTQFVIGLLV